MKKNNVLKLLRNKSFIGYRGLTLAVCVENFGYFDFEVNIEFLDTVGNTLSKLVCDTKHYIKHDR